MTDFYESLHLAIDSIQELIVRWESETFLQSYDIPGEMDSDWSDEDIFIFISDYIWMEVERLV